MAGSQRVYDACNVSIDLNPMGFNLNDPFSGVPGRTQYTSTRSTTNRHKKSIAPDLANINIGSRIKLVADEIYTEMGPPTRRNSVRKALVLYCIMCAFDRLNIPYDPKALAVKARMNPKSIAKSMGFDMKYHMGDFNRTREPEEYVPMYCKKSYIKCSPASIIPIARRVSDMLSEEFPQEVAMGCVLYFLEISTDSIDYSIISSSWFRTETALKSYKKMVSDAENS